MFEAIFGLANAQQCAAMRSRFFFFNNPLQVPPRPTKDVLFPDPWWQ